MNASPDLNAAILDELASIRTEAEAVQPLLYKLAHIDPDVVEVRAVAATLHAFYTGLERVLLLVAKNVDRSVPRSPRWHRELLSQMCEGNEQRPAILSADLATRFADYLAFRHVFRHSYSDQLRWTLMRPLADEMVTTLESFHVCLQEALGG